MAGPEGEAEDQVEGSDEEFLFHLGQGSELLGSGDAEGARGPLERALELRPRDGKALGLLGQAAYRSGRYDDAARAWQRLVDESPAHPAARVNLGLALLRGRRHLQAIRQLEIALELAPGHKKAMGYLGLALLEAGQPARARPWLVRAGSDGLVARCDGLLAAAGAPPPTPPVADVEPVAVTPAAVELVVVKPVDVEPVVVEPAVVEPPDAVAVDAEALPVEVEVEPAGAGALPVEVEVEEAVELTAGPPPAAPGPSLESAYQAPAAPAARRMPVSEAPPAPETPPGRQAADSPPALAAFAAAHGVELPAQTFGLAGGGLLAVRIRPAVRVRLSGLVAAGGTVRASPEVKWFRGRATERPFGAGRDRLHRVEGDGLLLLSAAGRSFTALRLAGPTYLREEALFGMEEAVSFENGRVPPPGPGELNLVLARGEGAVLLSTRAEPRAVAVRPEAPLRLATRALVGWLGALTPRLCLVLEGGPAELTGVELSGEGTVLVDPGGAEGEGGR